MMLEKGKKTFAHGTTMGKLQVQNEGPQQSLATYTLKSKICYCKILNRPKSYP
jgi:hypothetical protein